MSDFQRVEAKIDVAIEEISMIGKEVVRLQEQLKAHTIRETEHLNTQAEFNKRTDEHLKDHKDKLDPVTFTNRSFRKTATRALWVAYAAICSLTVKIIWFGGKPGG